MTKPNSAQKLLNRIQSENLKPRPKWIFTLRNRLFWVIGAIFLLLEGVAVSVIIYIFQSDDWQIYGRLTDGWLEFILLFLPIFWMLMLFIFISILIYDLKNTKRGYRYSIPFLLFFTVLIGVILGIIFFYSGVGKAIDEVLSGRAPYYGKIINPRTEFWCQPNKGRLSGMVIAATEDNTFNFRCCEGRDWIVKTEFQKNSFGSNRSEPQEQIRDGNLIRVLGEKENENHFTAYKILPMGSGKNFFQRNINREFGQPEQECLK